MPCVPVKVPGGSGFVCTRGRRLKPKFCVVCGGSATRLCDGPTVKASRSRTCDAPLCELHAVPAGDGRDCCPDCERRGRKPVQLELFK